jgi:undecaprenyl pyrophosphate synthase
MTLKSRILKAGEFNKKWHADHVKGHHSFVKINRIDFARNENYRLRPLLEALAELTNQVERIAVESDENNNFSRAEDEAQFYMDVAREALNALEEKLKEMGV